MLRNWTWLAVALVVVVLAVASCQDAAQDTGKGAKNAAGVAQKMKQSGSGEGGGDATSDN